MIREIRWGVRERLRWEEVRKAGYRRGGLDRAGPLTQKLGPRGFVLPVDTH